MTSLGWFLIAYLVIGQCVWELLNWLNPRLFFHRRNSPLVVGWGVVLLWPILIPAVVGVL